MAEGKKLEQQDREQLEKLLAGLGIDLPTTRLVRRDSLYLNEAVRVQQVDLTPEVYDDSSGADSSRRRCVRSGSIDLGGQAITDDYGKLEWKLSDFVCQSEGSAYEQPVSFVTTPHATEPVTMTAVVRSTGGDLVVDVFSWDVSGNAVPQIRFSWRCWVQTFPGGPGPASQDQDPP